MAMHRFVLVRMKGIQNRNGEAIGFLLGRNACLAQKYAHTHKHQQHLTARKHTTVCSGPVDIGAHAKSHFQNISIEHRLRVWDEKPIRQSGETENNDVVNPLLYA